MLGIDFHTSRSIFCVFVVVGFHKLVQLVDVVDNVLVFVVLLFFGLSVYSKAVV